MKPSPAANEPPVSVRHSSPNVNSTNSALRVLVVAPAWIGDAVMAQVLFKRLREYEPHIQIDALAPPWVAPVLARMPEIKHVIDNPFAHGELALSARYRLAREIAKTNYQRAYVLPNSLKSALIPFFACIPERIGFTGEVRYGLLNQRHTLDKAVLPKMIERFAQLAERPNAALTRPLPTPRLTSSPEQQNQTINALGFNTQNKIAVFCPGAEYGPAKRWPTQHFASLADALTERGYQIWLLGSAKDAAISETIVAQARNPTALHNLCGKTSLTQAIDLIATSEFVVCNDSGLMHVAAALDRPLIAVYGSSSPLFTPPLSNRAQIISLQLDCSPCFKRECPLGHLNCLNQLDPQRVLNACLSANTPTPKNETLDVQS